MAQIVKLRRSGVSGQKPTNANLQLGEIALNTTDGKVFFAKSGSLGPTIEEVISTNATNTGSINLIGDIIGSIFTGSFKGDGSGLYNIPLSGVTNLTIISSSIDNRLDILETYSGSYTGSFSGSFSGTTYVEYIDFNTGSVVPIQSGRLRWNNDEGTLSFGENESGVESFINQQLDYPLVFNDDTVNLVRGTLVMANPLDISQGDKLNIVRAISDGTYPSKLILGILKEDVAVSEIGIVQWFGKIKNVSITTLESNNIKFSGDTWFDGSILYADPNRPGGLTSIEPTAPNLKVTIAVVTGLAGNNVTLLIRPQLNQNIEELNNVKSENPLLGDLLVKSGSVWINTKQLNGSYGLTGSLEISGSQTIKGQQTISGSVYITEDLIVLGSSSLQNITASSVDIGTNTINLNTFLPSVRYGGINVFDSGSSGVSASLLWDSQTDNWIFVHEPVGGPVDSSYFLYGPLSQDGVGSEDKLTGDYLTKVENNGHGHHLTTSSLFDNGSKVSINSNTEITGSLIVTGGINGTLDYSFITNKPTLVSGSSQISHNSTTGYVANQHIDHTTVSISPGSGLSGGGTIAATRTLTLDTGSVHFLDGVKKELNTEGVISGSGQVILTSVNGYTTFSSSLATTDATQDGRLTSLETTTGSLNAFTSSVVLTSQTASMTVLSASFATTASFVLNAAAVNAPIGTYSTLVVTTPSTSWNFQHNTGQQYPIFQVFNENGYVVIPSQIRTIDNDNAEIIFSSPQSGRVVASLGGGNGTTEEFTNSSLWVVDHDLGTDYPDVTVWDSNRNIIFPNQIESVNSNQIKIYFSSPVSGHVSVSRGGHILSGGAVQVSWDEVNNKPSGIVSGSSQVLNGTTIHSGSFFNGISVVSGSGQVALTSVNGYATFSSSLATTNSTQDGRLTSIESKTGSFATTGSNIFKGTQIITGSLFVSENLIIAGSSSIQNISSSVLNVANNIITVNAVNPSLRFGGLSVNDSGSNPQVSGSILFDSVNNQWIFVHQNQSSVTSSVLLMGPETYNSLGNEAYLTQNRLIKGTGIEHLSDSNITDTGTKISINSNTEITGSVNVTGSLSVKSLGQTAPTLGNISNGISTILSNTNSSYGTTFFTKSNGQGSIQQMRVDGTATSYSLVFQELGGNVLIGTTTDNGYKLEVNGTIYATGDVIAYSDARVKTNIRPIENVIEKIVNSRGVIYDRTDQEYLNNIGFIAQELETTFPELVFTDVNGNKGVKYQNAVAVLFEAIKNQQKQIEDLKSLINK